MITQLKICSKTGTVVAAECIGAVSVRTAVSVILRTLIHVCVAISFHTQHTTDVP